MDKTQLMLNHYKRWNIEFDQEEQLTQLKNRVLVDTYELTEDFLVRNDIEKAFAYLLGEEVTIEPYCLVEYRDPLLPPPPLLPRANQPQTIKQRTFASTCVYKAIKEASNLNRLAMVLQSLFLVLEEYEHPHLIQLAKKVQSASRLTPGVGFQVAVREKSVILYPPGAELLDEGTVNEPLTWLEAYPHVATHFEQALRFYMAGDTRKYRNLLDNLRFALEQLLKEVLKNDKSLENQKPLLRPWFEQRGIHTQIISMYESLLFSNYALYQNNAVKHNEDFTVDEIEFIIYLTGNFMRFLLRLTENTTDQ